jgi:hypothetical protein
MEVEKVADLFVGEGEAESDEERLLRLEKEAKKRRELGRIVEFDPELGELVVKRRRKRDQEDKWEDFKP